MKIYQLFRKLIHSYFYEIRLQNKLLLAFLSMSLLLLGIFSSVIISHVSSFAENQLLQSATETFQQTTASLENTFYSYEQISPGLANSYLFDDLMKQDMNQYTPGEITVIRQNFERSVFASVQNHVNSTSYEVDVKIFFNDDFHYFNNRTRYFSLENYLSAPWASSITQQYSKSRRGFYILPEDLLTEVEPGNFSMARVVVDKKYYPHILALLRIDMPRKYLDQMITSTVFDNTLSAVINQDLNVLACSNTTLNSLLPDLISNYDLWKLPTKTWNEITLGHEKYLLRIVTIPHYKLMHFSLVPQKSLYSDLYRIRSFLLLSVFLTLLLCIPLASLLSHSLVIRLQQVVNVMQQVKTGNPVPFQENIPHGSDEIGNLISSYNHMVEQMQLLMQQEYEYGTEIKNAELKALQAQVNPHFLYNTLDMIYWFAKENMVNEIETSVRSLSTFYRIGLSSGKEIITLRDELSQSKAYMAIWNLRLQDAIIYECKVDDTLLDCLIIKTTLQPIIENAVSHGIREKDIPTGRISINVWADFDDLLITIEDDGVGIDSETLTKLNTDVLIRESVGHGYGVHNVQSRLQLYYGSAYGLKFSSTIGKGTCVTIRIPKKTTE